MSRTDAHTPVWVVDQREGLIKHDHSRGPCDAQQADEHYAKYRNTHMTHSHYNRCKKRKLYTATCYHSHHMVLRLEGGMQTGPNYTYVEVPVVHSKSMYRDIFGSYENELIKGEALTALDFTTCAELTATGCFPWNSAYRYRNDRWKTNEDGVRYHEYGKIVRDDAIPCSCDEAPHSARYFNCTREVTYEERAKHYKADRDSWFDAPRNSRSTVRDALKAYASSWNSNDEDLLLEDVYSGCLDY